ncbi:MAG: UDP-2,3-diacylglucosamine diphosphatase [Betaproteobacteria bacterium]
MSTTYSIDTKAHPATAALFISDLHLSSDTPKTTAVFFQFLQQQAAHTRQLYLLGDIFEYWAGDDDLDDAFNRSIIDALKSLSREGVEVYWIAGKRDFLVGEKFAAESSLMRLPDPCVINVAAQQVLLTHGDAYCTDDVDYMKFRHQVRNPAWQSGFLAQSLAERKQIIAAMREGSRAAQREKSMAIMDVNQVAIDNLFSQHQIGRIIHGHTHRPATHQHASGIRHVLPDWDWDHAPHRGGWLELDATGRFQQRAMA